MARRNDSSLSRNYTIAACCGTGLATQTTLAFYLKGSGSLHLRPQWWVSSGFICLLGGLKFEKCWNWFFNWDLANNLSYSLDVFRQVICLGKAFTLLVCLKLVIVLSALCFFFLIGCFDRCWESLLYLLALTNKKTVMTTRQNFKIFRKTA